MADDAAANLKRALEEAARLRRENVRLSAAVGERTTQLFGEAGARISAQDSAIDGQIAAAESEHAANQREWERLQAEGDFTGAGAAMSKMIRATARIESLNRDKEQIIIQRSNLERSQQQTQQPNGGDQLQNADPLAGMNELERQWVSAHPDYLSNPDYAERVRGAAAYASQTLRMSRDSQEYIDFINNSIEPGGARASSANPAPPAMSIGGDDDEPTDVSIPRMPEPVQPRPVAMDPAEDQAMQMVDQMFPQQRAVGNGSGTGIRSVAAPPSRVVRQLSDQIRRGRAIEPTLEELDTAKTLAAQIDPEVYARGDEEVVRWYYNLYNSPSSQRKLRRWYGRAA